MSEVPSASMSAWTIVIIISASLLTTPVIRYTGVRNMYTNIPKNARWLYISLWDLNFSGSVSCKIFVPRRKLAVVPINVIRESTIGNIVLLSALGPVAFIVVHISSTRAEANTITSMMILPINPAISCPSVLRAISDIFILRGQKLDIE